MQPLWTEHEPLQESPLVCYVCAPRRWVHGCVCTCLWGPSYFCLMPRLTREPMQTVCFCVGVHFMRRWAGTLSILPHSPTQEWQEQSRCLMAYPGTDHYLVCQIPFRNHLKTLPVPCSSQGFPTVLPTSSLHLLMGPETQTTGTELSTSSQN